MRHWLVLLLVSAWVLPGLGADAARIPVVATILPAYCVATNVGGDRADVRYLAGAGGDGHDYQLTPRDRTDLGRARLVLMNGLGIEPWLKRVLSSVNRDCHVVELARGLEPQLIPAGREQDHQDHHGHGEWNPHAWLDPGLMARMVTNALRGFQQVDPANASVYIRNASDFVARLEALDRSMEEGLRELRGTSIVTYHDAFPYFARRYGLKVAAVVEEVPDVDPTPRDLARLRELIRLQNVRALFVEPRHSSRLATQLGRDLGIQIGTLDALEVGPSTATAYEDGMKRNLQNLRKTLSGAKP